MLAKSLALQDVAPIVRHHHERFDGQGYPDRKKGQKIPLESRVITVANSVEAMTSIRPYRQGSSLAEVVTELQLCAGTQFDPGVVEAFCGLVACHGESLLRDTPAGPVDQAIPVAAVYFQEPLSQQSQQQTELRLTL